VTLISPNAALNLVINGVSAAIANSTDASEKTKLTDASKKLSDALDPSLWSNGQPTDKDGDRIFNDLQLAVQKFAGMVGSNTSVGDATLRGWISMLADSAKRLAQARIDLSTSTPGADAKKLSDANAEM